MRAYLGPQHRRKRTTTRINILMTCCLSPPTSLTLSVDGRAWLDSTRPVSFFFLIFKLKYCTVRCTN